MLLFALQDTVRLFGRSTAVVPSQLSIIDHLAGLGDLSRNSSPLILGPAEDHLAALYSSLELDQMPPFICRQVAAARDG